MRHYRHMAFFMPFISRYDENLYRLRFMVGVVGSRKACRNLVPVCQPAASAAHILTALAGGFQF
jgi:hypothetical protein